MDGFRALFIVMAVSFAGAAWASGDASSGTGDASGTPEPRPSTPAAGAVPLSAEIGCNDEGQQVLRLAFEEGVLASDASFTGWLGNDVGSGTVTFTRTSSTSIEAPVDRALLGSFQLGYVVDTIDASGSVSLRNPSPERCPM